jgi:hypothetical protein
MATRRQGKPSERRISLKSIIRISTPSSSQVTKLLWQTDNTSPEFPGNSSSLMRVHAFQITFPADKKVTASKISIVNSSKNSNVTTLQTVFFLQEPLFKITSVNYGVCSISLSPLSTPLPSLGAEADDGSCPRSLTMPMNLNAGSISLH